MHHPPSAGALGSRGCRRIAWKESSGKERKAVDIRRARRKHFYIGRAHYVQKLIKVGPDIYKIDTGNDIFNTLPTDSSVFPQMEPTCESFKNSYNSYNSRLPQGYVRSMFPY